MKNFKLGIFKEYSIFFWLFLISILGIFLWMSISLMKEENSHQIKSSLNNIYLKKTVKEIANSLEPRYTNLTYKSKPGDTFESIINKLGLSKEEKKKVIDTILKEKSLKILRVNQKFTFKFDHLNEKKIIEFKIETDKKNEIIFT